MTVYVVYITDSGYYGDHECSCSIHGVYLDKQKAIEEEARLGYQASWREMEVIP